MTTTSFTETKPTLDTYWRAIILFGRNSASYKFALARALLEFAHKEQTFVSLEELADPFSKALLEHLKLSDKQGTARSSNFLDSLREFNGGKIAYDEMIAQTMKYGFVNVIDAFHIVNQSEIPTKFFIDERKHRSGITLTDELLSFKEHFQFQNLPQEVEARWRLVETAWELNLSPSLLAVKHDPEQGLLFLENNDLHRINITSCKDALNGYQRGKCFYCFSEISIDSDSPDIADVDHFFPHTLAQYLPPNININGIWNLVLSCQACNRGASGKFAKVPELRYLERLHRRNNYLIESHHPLRETIMLQTGRTESQRRSFLQKMDRLAIENLIFRWKPDHEEAATF